MDKKQTRIRRAARTRARIARLNVHRLSVHRTNAHLYAQIFSPCGTQVLASASTLEAEVRQQLSSKGSNIAAATFIGHRIAQKAKAAGIESLACDRSGFRYHGRVRAWPNRRVGPVLNFREKVRYGKDAGESAARRA